MSLQEHAVRVGCALAFRGARLGRRVVRHLVRLSAPLDPSLPVARHRLAPGEAALLMVYRHANAHLVLDHVRCVRRSNWPVLLWALDRVHPDLERWTVGCGPGTRFAHLNELATRVSPDRFLLISDDDVLVPRGELVTALGIASRLRFGLAGISHTGGGHVSHQFTVARPLVLGRLTTFVEIGPVLVVAPEARPLVLPFPEEGMGWGTEVLWAKLARSGLRVGIVDAVRVEHLGPPGGAYDRDSEWDALRSRFREHGVGSWDEIQQVVRTYWCWSRLPAA